MYFAGLFNLSKLILPSMYCCIASEPIPYRHSARRIAKPSSLIASEQFHKEERDLPNVWSLFSFPVLIIIALCFPTSFIAIAERDFDIDVVVDG